MDWNKYTDYHVHPQDNHLVEIVAYERLDGAWDVYVFEPTGTCPELEADRVDNNHIFVGKMESRFDINRIADTVDRQLGDEYQCEVYYREAGSRRIIGKITAHLMKRVLNMYGYALPVPAIGNWLSAARILNSQMR